MFLRGFSMPRFQKSDYQNPSKYSYAYFPGWYSYVISDVWKRWHAHTEENEKSLSFIAQDWTYFNLPLLVNFRLFSGVSLPVKCNKIQKPCLSLWSRCLRTSKDGQFILFPYCLAAILVGLTNLENWCS